MHVGVCSACICVCVCVYFHSSYGYLESLLFDFELFLIFDTEMIMLEYGSGESELSCKCNAYIILLLGEATGCDGDCDQLLNTWC